MWLNPECVVFRERSQTQKATEHVTLLTCNVQNCKPRPRHQLGGSGAGKGEGGLWFGQPLAMGGNMS
jgi:hypothetical protein